MGLFSSSKPSIFSSFDPVKAKATIRMASTRLSMQKNKLVNSVKVQRRGVAELLAMGKYDSARIRVETCVRDDVSIEGYEVLALFLDLLGNRTQLIAESKPMKSVGKSSCVCPPELKECITSILWCSGRISDVVPELTTLRKMFESKYGAAFVEMSLGNTDFSVNPKLMERIGLYTPSNDKCVQYLKNVAEEYNLPFDEEKLRDSSSVVASVVATDAGGSADGLRTAIPGATRSPSGLYIPAMEPPYDVLDQRLLRLKAV